MARGSIICGRMKKKKKEPCSHIFVIQIPYSGLNSNHDHQLLKVTYGTGGSTENWKLVVGTA
jgi:hypothetical protein